MNYVEMIPKRFRTAKGNKHVFPNVGDLATQIRT